MNIGLFGGTFDPIHRGHINVARAAADRYGLKEVWFVPADVPPHKQKAPITSYYHRYAMVALATAGEKGFLPSLLEAPDCAAGEKQRRPSYSIETVRRVKSMLGKRDRLCFLIGMDAFRDIAIWYKAEELLRECDFIVAARPGYSLMQITASLPKAMRPSTAGFPEMEWSEKDQALTVSGARLLLLPETHENISATRIRAVASRGRGLNKLVPDTVAEYISKLGLYAKPRSTAGTRR